MSSALLARRAVPAIARQARTQTPRLSRALHVENTAETSLPFGQGPKYKVPIAVGLTSFLALGFSLPFLAAKFQMSKAG